MTSRERIISALRFEEFDKVPLETVMIDLKCYVCTSMVVSKKLLKIQAIKSYLFCLLSIR